MNDKKTEKGIINGALSLTVSAIIVKFLGLIYKIPLSYILSDEGMGYFNTAYTVFGFFYIICTAGIPKAISILVSEAEGDGNRELIDRIYTTAFRMFIVLGLFVSVLLFILSAPISKLIGNSKAYYSMLLISPSILFVCATGVIRGYFNGRLNFVPIAISELISGASKVVLGLALAYLAHTLGYGFEIISAFTIFGTTLGSFFGFVYLYFNKCEFSKIKTGQKLGFSPALAKKIFKIAIPLTITSAIGSVSNIIDLTIIMRRLQAAGNTALQAAILYGNYTTLAIPMLNLVATLVAPLSAVLLPIISKEKNNTKSTIIEERISASLKILLFITIPISILFLFKSGEILSLLFEDSSAVMAAPLLSLIAPGVIFMSLLTVTNSALEGMGDTKTPMISLLLASFVKLIVSYVLIGNTNFGLFGASIGTTLSYFIGMCVSVFALNLKHKIRLHVIKSFFLFIVCGIISLGISNIFSVLINISTPLTIVVELLIFSLFYLLALLAVGFFKLNNLNSMSNIYKKTIK